MIKLGRFVASLAVAAVFLGGSPAAAQQGVPVHRTTIYSDASKTTVVGYIEFDYCTYYGGLDAAQYHLEGSYNPQYQDEELIGYCHQWEFQPV